MADNASLEYQYAHISQSRVPSLITSGAICLSAAYIAVTLRLISRRLAHARLESDDWCIILGLVFTSGFTLIIFALIPFGLGRHAVLIRRPIPFAKIVIAGQVIYNPAVVAIKSSILLLYRRLFPGRRFNALLWSIGFFVLSYSTVQSIVEVFQCTPINATWDPQIKGKCIKLSDELLVSSALNVITDCLLLVLPLPILWRLQISRDRKLQLIAIFLLGGFVCVVSIIRAPEVRDVSLTDPSWSDVDGIVWSMVELNIGIVSGCLPTLRPVFVCLFRGRRQTIAQAKNSATSGNSRSIRLHGLNRPPIGEDCQELKAPANADNFVELDRDNGYPRAWEIHPRQQVYAHGGNGCISESKLEGADKNLGPTSNTISITTEVNVKESARSDHPHF